MKMSTSATVQRKTRQRSRIRDVELEKENIEEWDTGAIGKLEKTVTRYRHTIDKGVGKKIDKVSDKVDTWADRVGAKYEEQYEKYNQKWNDTVMYKVNELEHKIRGVPFGAWLCTKCCDDSAAMKCGEGEENLKICSLRGLLDFVYLITFFMGSAMAATISLTYFEPKVNDRSPEQPYSKSFLAGDYCNDYDTIAGRMGLDGLRAGLSFFSPENADLLFENGAGTRCTDSLANYGLLGLTDFEAFAKEISDMNGTVADPFIFGGSVEMIQKYQGDPMIMFAAAGDSDALADLKSDTARAVFLWNGAGVVVPGGSDLLSTFPDADPPTNWEWCMDVYEDKRSKCDKYIVNVERYPNFDPCMFLYEINMPYTSAPASQVIIDLCQDWTYVNPHGPKPTPRPTRYPVEANSTTNVDFDKCDPEWIGDQICDPDCNYAIFGFDGGDCEGKDPDDFKPECDYSWLGDGHCDEGCNNEENGWDYGDCGDGKDSQSSGQCQEWCSNTDDLFVTCGDYRFQCGGCEMCGPMCTEEQMDEEAPDLMHDDLKEAGGYDQYLHDLEGFLFCEPDMRRMEHKGGDMTSDECMRQKCALLVGIMQHVDLTPAAFQCSVEPGIPDGNIATWLSIQNSFCNGEEPANDPWRDAYEKDGGDSVECGSTAAHDEQPLCMLCGTSPGECDSNDCSWNQDQQRCLPEGSSGVDGETACENHGFGFDQCMSVGCCQWDHQYGQCWSNVGRSTCEPGTGDGDNGGGHHESRGGEAACENHGFGYDQCMDVGCCQWDDNEGECYSDVGDSPCDGGNHGGDNDHHHGGGQDGNGEHACERRGYGYDQCMDVGCCQWDHNEGECYSAVGTDPCHRRRLEDTFEGQLRRLLNDDQKKRGRNPTNARRRASTSPIEHCAALSTADSCNADTTCAYDSRIQNCIILSLHCKKFSAENLCVADGKCSWTPPAPSPAPGPAPVDGVERRRFGGGGFSRRDTSSNTGKCAPKKKNKCPDYTDMASCDAQDPKCRWNIALNKCDVKPVVRKPRSAVKKLPSLDDEYCMKKTKTIGQIQRLEKFSTTFNVTQEDYDVMYKLGCVKDWARDDSDGKRQAVFEMYILSLLFYVFLIFDMNQFIQKTFWAMVFRVTFSLTYIYEFSLFVGYWQKGQQDESWFDIVTWPFVDFSTATKSDAYIAKFLSSVMTTRGLSVTVIVICVFFGKVKGSSARVNENMNARRGFNLLYFVLVLGLSTICAVMSLYAYQADEVTDSIAASNFIGGTCGDGVMGKHFYELYPTGWQTDPNTDHKMLNCINVKIANNFQNNIRMFVVAYTSTLLFYVYLLHNVRNEFTKRGSWLVFRILFICAYMTEYMYWLDFHSSYKELKMEYKTTHQIHPEAAIITKLTNEVYKCRIAVVSVLVLIQVLEDMLCKRISDRLCCDGKEEEEIEDLKLTAIDLEMTSKRTPGSPKTPEVAQTNGSEGVKLSVALRELSTQI